MSAGGPTRTLAGRYRLEEVIGRGGMSTVYRATDLALDRVVAVKVALDPLAEENPIYVARFKREAHAAAALSHPGVATVYDAGADGSTRYIVMELVDGRSLSDMLRDEGPLAPARAAGIAAQVAETLAAAHAAGIVHRDIKPGNIMVGAGDRVKLLDFGIARTADAVTLTQTASVLGTAPYMSPEQAMGNPADARSDIYSLGCVLYEMLTGKPPFMAEVPAAVLHQHVRVAPKSPRTINPAIPPGLDALVLHMLAKAPSDRPQTAAEVRDRLAGYASDTPTAPTRRLPPAVDAAAAAAAMAADVPQGGTVAQAGTAPPEATAAPPGATAASPETASPPPETASPPPATAVTPPGTADAPRGTAGTPPGTAGNPPGTAATRPIPPRPPSRSPRRGLWAVLAALAIVLLGAAVAFGLSGGASSTSRSTDSHPAATATVTATSGASTHSTSPPTTSPSTTHGSSSSTTASTTTTTVTTTTSASTATTAPAPPGQGGAPPGQTKKKDKSK
ncbi:MAG: serine/threonine protein kinase [Solirubrobacterales bacterium]|nr:serine/threonine protein kinase [Solirubrobacterales bacterium]